MVTAETKEKVELRSITLEELGELVGIPIKVCPWWGSARRRWVEQQLVVTLNRPRRAGEILEDATVTKSGPAKVHMEWLCSGLNGSNTNHKKPPEIQKGAIILWEGPCRYKPNGCQGWQHAHAQTIEVKSVDQQAMLIAIWLSRTAIQFLIGVDGGSPYVVRVGPRVQTVEEAFDWLMPKTVKESIAQGLDVRRQGDWYFIPRDKPPVILASSNDNRGDWQFRNVFGSAPGLRMNTLYRGVPLIFNGGQTRHTAGMVVYQTIQGVNGLAPIVKGNIKAPDHEPLRLKNWHTAIRNRSHPWRNAERRVDD